MYNTSANHIVVGNCNVRCRRPKPFKVLLRLHLIQGFAVEAPSFTSKALRAPTKESMPSIMYEVNQARITAELLCCKQVFHVDVPSLPSGPPSGDALVGSVNKYLRQQNHDISLTSAIPSHPSFSARRNIYGKRYLYRLLVPAQPAVHQPVPLLGSDTAWVLRRPLDVQAMMNAAHLFEGCHDFSRFRATGYVCSSAREFTQNELTDVQLRSRDSNQDTMGGLCEHRAPPKS